MSEGGRIGGRECIRGNELCLHMPKVVTDEWLVHVHIQYMYLCQTFQLESPANLEI